MWRFYAASEKAAPSQGPQVGAEVNSGPGSARAASCSVVVPDEDYWYLNATCSSGFAEGRQFSSGQRDSSGTDQFTPDLYFLPPGVIMGRELISRSGACRFAGPLARPRDSQD